MVHRMQAVLSRALALVCGGGIVCGFACDRDAGPFPKEVDRVDVKRVGREWADAVLGMMDDGTICVGSDIARIRARVGEPCSSTAISGRDGVEQDLYYQPQPPSIIVSPADQTQDIIAGRQGPVGWYLVVQHHGGNVVSYYLSNWHGK